MAYQYTTEQGKAPADVDPLAGQEIALLNQMLAAVMTPARAGDGPSIDRALKILELKRKLHEDSTPQGDWSL